MASVDAGERGGCGRRAPRTVARVGAVGTEPAICRRYEHRLVGRVISFEPYHLRLDRGPAIVLHHGTVIHPRGMTPRAGMPVRVYGHSRTTVRSPPTRSTCSRRRRLCRATRSGTDSRRSTMSEPACAHRAFRVEEELGHVESVDWDLARARRAAPRSCAAGRNTLRRASSTTRSPRAKRTRCARRAIASAWMLLKAWYAAR